MSPKMGRGGLEGRFEHRKLKMLVNTLKHCIFCRKLYKMVISTGYSLFALPVSLHTFLFLALCSWKVDS